MLRKQQSPVSGPGFTKGRVILFDEEKFNWDKAEFQGITCRYCVHYILKSRRPRCRWTGEYIVSDGYAPDCWGFEYATSTEGGAA